MNPEADEAMKKLAAYLSDANETWANLVKTSMLVERIASLDPLIALVAETFTKILAEDEELLPEVEAAIASLHELAGISERLANFVRTRIDVETDRLIAKYPTD
jgi:lipopolysaccharide biosynthesis regulator YciM